LYSHLETEFFLRVALANTTDIDGIANIKEELGTLLLSLRRLAEAEEVLAELSTLENVAGDHSRLLAIEAQRIKIALKRGNLPPDSLIQWINILAAQAAEYGEQRINIALLISLISVGHSIGKRDIVLNAVTDLSRLANTVNDVGSEVAALTTAANVIGLYKGIPAALQYADDAVKRARRSKDERLAIKALCSRGVNRMQAGMLTQAEDDFKTALELIETFAVISEQQYAMGEYAIMLLERGDYSAARAVLDDAIKMTSDYNAILDQVVVTGNLLLTEYESGNHDAAAALAAEVLTLSEQAPFLWCMIGAWSILGLYALERGDLELAREYRGEILTHSEGHNFWVSDASYAEIFFARLMVMEGDFETALARLESAIAAYADRDIFCRSRLQLERARMLVTRDPVAAGEQAAEIRARGKEIGARPLVEKAELILDQLPAPSSP
jgi:tetratricopeptide (TPR) repeat protein